MLKEEIKTMNKHVIIEQIKNGSSIFTIEDYLLNLCLKDWWLSILT